MDPLLATAMGCGMLNANEVKRPATPVDDDEIKASTSENTEIDDEAWQLVVHARVYALADK